MDSARIARHARAHHGVFDQAFLATVGVDPSRAAREVRAGRWRRIHEGVYAAAATPDTVELRVEAALAALPRAVLGLRPAAWVHEVASTPAELDLLVPTRSRNRLAGARIHQIDLPAHHLVQRRGWRLTSLERTLVDLGKVLVPTVLQRCIEDAVLTRRTTLARVERVFAEAAAPGRTGIARTRAVLARLDPSPPTESELEAMFLRLVRRHGLPEPVRQAGFEWLDRGAGRVDFWYPDAALIVELDGRRFHLRAEAYEADRRRDRVALRQGVRTVRVTHRDLATEAAAIVGDLREILRGGDPGSLRRMCTGGPGSG